MNNKFTYEDFIARKKKLKKEVQEMEYFLSLENALSIIKGSVKNKTVELAQNPESLNLLLGAGLSLGINKFISKYVNEKNFLGKAILFTSSYLVPVIVEKSKKIIEDKFLNNKK